MLPPIGGKLAYPRKLLNSSSRQPSSAEVLAPPTVNEGTRTKRHPNRFMVIGGMTVLFCRASSGAVFGVRIDTEDVVRVLKAGTWRVANFDSCNGRTNLYAYCKYAGTFHYLHRFILNAPPKSSGLEVDHVHHRNLDCRKSEIRLVSKSENQRNQRKPSERRAAREARRYSLEVRQG